MMAARSLIQLFRAVNPALLPKKDRVRKLFSLELFYRLKSLGAEGGGEGVGRKGSSPTPMSPFWYNVPFLVDRVNLLFVVNLLNYYVLYIYIFSK